MQIAKPFFFVQILCHYYSRLLDAGKIFFCIIRILKWFWVTFSDSSTFRAYTKEGGRTEKAMDNIRRSHGLLSTNTRFISTEIFHLELLGSNINMNVHLNLQSCASVSEFIYLVVCVREEL